MVSAAARILCRTGGFDRRRTIQALEDGERFVGRRAAVDGRLQQPARFLPFAALKRGDAAVQELLGLALALGERAAGPLDVGARTRMVAIQEERARPDVDGVLVAGGEIVVQTDQQQLLDLRVAIDLGGHADVSILSIATMDL